MNELCDVMDDGTHCNCWWDGESCCACGEDDIHPLSCDYDRTEKHEGVEVTYSLRALNSIPKGATDYKISLGMRVGDL